MREVSESTSHDRIPPMALSIYIHIPFCTRRCTYCDFNTYSGISGLIPEYIRAVEAEIRQSGLSALALHGSRLPVRSVYFGGGTPSVLTASQVGTLLDAVRCEFALEGDAEITLEANPESMRDNEMQRMSQAGINRVSLGTQSFIDSELQVLGRSHSCSDTREAVQAVRSAGIENLSLDLIYGIPGQTPTSWLQSLDDVLSLQPQHLSLYSLTIETGTILENRIHAGDFPEPDPDLMAGMYEQADVHLTEAGFLQYEISNWALPGASAVDGQPYYASRHNLQYWLNEPYLGLGAGASGFAAGYRTRTVLHPAGYIRLMRQGERREFPFTAAVIDREPISRQREIEDTIMMGLRLTHTGLNRKRFQGRFGISPEQLYPSEVEKLAKQGLLELTPDALRLTPHGRLLGNRVFAEFIS